MLKLTQIHLISLKVSFNYEYVGLFKNFLFNEESSSLDMLDHEWLFNVSVYEPVHVLVLIASILSLLVCIYSKSCQRN